MTKEIKLNNGMVALVDDEDYVRINAYHWKAHEDHRHPGRFYADRNTWDGKHVGTVSMSREILNAPKGIQVDHIEIEQTLDNRKSNLRLATSTQNQGNKNKSKNNKSGFKGVKKVPYGNKWVATIGFNKELIHLGTYDSPEEAARAYDAKSRELYGEFSRTNF